MSARTGIEFRSPRADDLYFAVEALQAAGLPTEDLTPDFIRLVAEVDGAVAGLVGLQSYGDYGLLRSLVVSPKFRGSGIGRQLVEALETLAAADGMRQLWLLTIDADRFFAALGYQRQKRSKAPAAIAATEEFSSLCPDAAVCMSKLLVV